MKRIVLMPTKNDAWILEKTLACILLWADYVIVADQNSTDNTLEICSRSPKVKVLNNNSQYHSTKVRQMLLEEARKIEGYNFIFSIDSDEIVSADILNDEFWGKIAQYEPGTAFEFQWINLWRSLLKFRNDNSIWSNSWKSFAFIDNRKSRYNYIYDVNDHNSRVPVEPKLNQVRLEIPKVLHYQFVNWDRMLSKQRFYRMHDFLQKKLNFFSAFKINLMYFFSKQEKKLTLGDVNRLWIEPYLQKNINVLNIVDRQPYWYDLAVLGWFKKNGVKKFATLDIWDIDWEAKRLAAKTTGARVPEASITDPRNIFIKFYHRHQLWLYRFVVLLRKVRPLVKK